VNYRILKYKPTQELIGMSKFLISTGKVIRVVDLMSFEVKMERQVAGSFNLELPHKEAGSGRIPHSHKISRNRDVNTG
jgi:hypothetical protein